ncbi:MAG TPA: hypothetical protein VGJ81_14885 [Thermoanaerobaculia bacterium]|jgi:hypothetical protein
MFSLLLAVALSVTPVDALTQLKQLAGKWSGKTDRGAPIVITYQVAAHGSTVVETQSPGEPDEMLTVYSLDGNDLVLTHYCPMGPVGNQPHMALDRTASTPRDLRFTFVRLANLDAEKDVHLHAGRIRVVDDHHLERQWDVYKGGKKVGTETFVLEKGD